MDKENHNKNVIEVFKNSIDYVRHRQDYLTKHNLFREHNAISEEFKEWLKKGYQMESIIYLIEFTK